MATETQSPRNSLSEKLVGQPTPRLQEDKVTIAIAASAITKRDGRAKIFMEI